MRERVDRRYNAPALWLFQSRTKKAGEPTADRSSGPHFPHMYADSRRIPLFPELKQSTSRAKGQVDWDNIGVTVLLRAAVPWSAVGGKSAAPSAARQVGYHPFFEHAQVDADHRQDIDRPCENCHCPGLTVSLLDLSLHVQRLTFVGIPSSDLVG